MNTTEWQSPIETTEPTTKGPELPKNARVLHGAEKQLAFLFANNATVTLVSLKTGTRFTYHIGVAKDDDDKPKADGPYFVAVKNGPDFGDRRHVLTVFNKSRVGFKRGQKAPPSAKAFAWWLDKLIHGVEHPDLQVWHMGACGRCGRPLTRPDSIQTGYGPVCAAKLEI